MDPGEAGVDGGNSDATGEAGSYGRFGGGPNTPVEKDTSARKSAGRKAGSKSKLKKSNIDTSGAAADSAGAQAKTGAGAAAESSSPTPDAAGEGADSVANGSPKVDSGSSGAGNAPQPARIQSSQPGSDNKSKTAERSHEFEKPGKPNGLPTLILLPLSVASGTPEDSGRIEKAEAALRLGFEESHRFHLLTLEESIREYQGTGGRLPKRCFTEACVTEAARKLGSALFIASEISGSDSLTCIKLVLAETPEGNIRRAGRVWGKPRSAGIIPFAREAALLLGEPDRVRNDTTLDGVPPITAGAEFAVFPWKEIPWLNPKDSVDNRLRWGWSGTGFLLAGLGLAWAEGTLTQEDGNSTRLQRDVLSGAGGQSFLRGFFAMPSLGARYAAMGGAGIAHVDNGLALSMNPAGVAQADRENVIAAKRSLPDGTPSFSLAYASPLFHQWAQGLGVQYEGDRLANETTLQGALACDLGAWGKSLAGIKAGAEVKLYLAQVGEAGTGEDRSTGRSFGMGLDLGLQSRITDKLTAALAVRDIASFLRHSNTLTDQSYAEILPTEYRLGASYRASPSLLLLLDGQKGMWADQVDHLRLGGEQTLWQFLAIRAGLHEVLGREAVRKLSVGFGLDTDGMTDRNLKMKIALNYAYEFGLNEDEPLGAGQQFSLEASF